MRWKISRQGHDPRQIDLLAVFALLILIVAAFRYFDGAYEPTPRTTAFVTPGDDVRW